MTQRIGITQGLSRSVLRLCVCAAVGGVVGAGCSGGADRASPAPDKSKGQAAGDQRRAADRASKHPPLSDVECAAIHKAHATVITQFQVIMQQLTEDDGYRRFLAGEITVGFAPDTAALRDAVVQLRKLPDLKEDNPFPTISEVLPRLTAVADLLEKNIKSGKPFADNSGNGRMLVEMVNAESVGIIAAIAKAAEAVGCKPK